MGLEAQKEERKPVIGLLWEPNMPFLTSSTNNNNNKSKYRGDEPESSGSVVWRPQTELIDGLYVPPNNPKKLNKLLRKNIKDTAGKNWFDMPAPTMTPELKKDLQLLKLRNVMDPKRHYKKGSKSKELPKYFQVGTVIESSTDFYTGRLTKKERKATLADDILSDDTLKNYRKRKVREIEEQNRPAGNDKWKIRGRHSQKRAKQRRYLKKIDEAVLEVKELTQGGSLSLIGHPAGGWLARVYMEEFGLNDISLLLLTLGTPHLPPPKGVSEVIDQTRGFLNYVETHCTKAMYSPELKYIQGAHFSGNAAEEGNTMITMDNDEPIAEAILVNDTSKTVPLGSSFRARFVGQGYKQVCGQSDEWGDGQSAYLGGSNDELRPSYGSPAVVEKWIHHLLS